jgi:hypothetical protein
MLDIEEKKFEDETGLAPLLIDAIAGNRRASSIKCGPSTRRLAPLAFALCVFIAVILSILVAVTNGKKNMSNTIVFLFRDAGEWFGLFPCFQLLQNTPNTQVLGVIIDGGTAPSSAQNLPGVRLLSSYGVNMQGSNRKRNATLDSLQYFTNAMPKSGLLISGMVSRAQVDISKSLVGWSVAGYDDSFSLWNEKSWPALFVKKGVLTQLWVTAEEIVSEVEKSQSKRLAPSSFSTFAVGSPTFKSWESESSHLSPYDIQRIRLYMFGTSVNKPGVLFFGGYGSGYYDAVQIFAEAAAGLKNELRFAFLPHPGPFNTTVEAMLFSKANVSVHILDRSHYSTALYAKASGVTLSQDSTCGPQSVSIGVRSMYVMSEGAAVDDIFTKIGLIPVARNKSAATFLMKKLIDNGPFDPKKALQNAGIPNNSAQNIIHRVRALAQKG